MMTSPFKAYLARQLGCPSGWMGRLILRSLNQENVSMNVLSLNVLDVQTGQHILEIGFGGGDLIERLLKTEIPIKVTAIDISRTAVEMAHNRFRQAIATNRLEVHQAKIEAMPFEDHSFNAIVTVNTLYFWSDTLAAFRECQRCLKPGGKLIITYTSKEFLEAQQATQFGFQAYEVSHVEELFRAADFDEVETMSSSCMNNGKFFYTSGTTVK